jgi:RNA polymerase sigma-70 factor (ECF subfamily)
MSVLRRGKSKPPEPLRRQRFEELVLPQLDTLYRVALRLTCNREQAEDLVQETCLRAYRTFDSFDGQNGRAWLFTILRHTHISRWRHDGDGSQCISYDDEASVLSERTLPVDPSAEETALANLFAEDIERALGALPVEARLLLLLAYVEELSYAEIAQVMDCPIGTVMSRLYRARHHMEELLASTRIKQGEPDRA